MTLRRIYVFFVLEVPNRVSSGVNRCTPLVDGHMVDVHSALDQQLFDIAIGESISGGTSALPNAVKLEA